MGNLTEDQKINLCLFLIDIKETGISDIKAMREAIEHELIVRTQSGFKLTLAGHETLEKMV